MDEKPLTLADTLKAERRAKIQNAIHNYLTHLLIVDELGPRAALEQLGMALHSSSIDGIRSAAALAKVPMAGDEAAEIVVQSFSAYNDLWRGR